MYNWEKITNKIYNETINKIKNNEIHDEKLIFDVESLYEITMNMRNDDDYIVNQPQLDKFNKVLDFFIKCAEECDGFVEPVKFIPKEEHCGLTAYFLVFDVFGKEMLEFSKILSYLSSFSIDATSDGVCISVNVPNVFIPKRKNK